MSTIQNNELKEVVLKNLFSASEQFWFVSWLRSDRDVNL